jgi:hypothetical protein
MRSELSRVVLGVVFLTIALFVIWNLPGDQASTAIAINRLKIGVGYTLLALIFLFGFAILIHIAQGKIDLSDLLSEGSDGKASMSRFQLLIFTLVIALSLFLVVANDMKFPTIPAEILTLLGISASTYAVSKGIQAGSDATTTETKTPNATVTTTSPATTPPPATVTTTAPVVPGATPPTATPAPPPATQTTTTTIPPTPPPASTPGGSSAI